MSWWDENVSIDIFKRWVKGVNAPSRKYVREYISGAGYTNVLDVGAGLCEDYYGFLGLGGKVHYNAVDFTEQFVEASKPVGIHIHLSECDKLHFDDMVFDVAYCRHLVEHLPYYETTLTDMIRVSKKEVIITFFLPPQNKPDVIHVNNKLHHNIYDKRRISSFAMASERVYDIRWEDFGPDESILFIKLS
jgi:ubiquinone/menaquinone biosynthesis C-methylase UbiE